MGGSALYTDASKVISSTNAITFNSGWEYKGCVFKKMKNIIFVCITGANPALSVEKDLKIGTIIDTNFYPAYDERLVVSMAGGDGSVGSGRLTIYRNGELTVRPFASSLNWIYANAFYFVNA